MSSFARFCLCALTSGALLFPCERQERLRENIRSMEKVVGENPLLQRYLKDLDKEEDGASPR